MPNCAAAAAAGAPIHLHPVPAPVLLALALALGLAWLAWLGLHLVALMGNRNRLATLANWSVRYLSWPGSLNVITGDPPD